MIQYENEASTVERPGKVIAFYSPEEGIGKSLDVANTGVILANSGLRVLMVDFNLGKPSLDTYPGLAYRGEIRPAGLGRFLINTVTYPEVHEDIRGYGAYILPVSWATDNLLDPEQPCPPKARLALLPAWVRPEEAEGPEMSEAFKFVMDAAQGKRDILDRLAVVREQFQANFDITLIDTSARYFNTAAVVTRFLADHVVNMLPPIYLGGRVDGATIIPEVIEPEYHKGMTRVFVGSRTMGGEKKQLAKRLGIPDKEVLELPYDPDKIMPFLRPKKQLDRQQTPLLQGYIGLARHLRSLPTEQTKVLFYE